MAAFTFGWFATAIYLGGYDTIPESRRYAIEFELFLAMTLVEAIRLGTRHGNGTVRLCAMGTAVVLLLAGTPQMWAYLHQGWDEWRPAPREDSIEYRLARWMTEHPPEGRVFASGGLRFRMNSWFDLAQVGGGSETGLQNRTPWDLAYRIRTAHGGEDSAATLAMLRAMDTQYVAIHGPRSREYYRDFVKPDRVSGTLAAVYREEDDTVYGFPPRPMAFLLNPGEAPGKDPAEHPEGLAGYVAAMDDGARPEMRVVWRDPNTVEIAGPVEAGKLVAVNMNSDAGWHATEDGREIPIATDNLGFMELGATPSAGAHIELRYRVGAEPRIFAAVSGLAWAGALAGLWLWRKRSASMK